MPLNVEQNSDPLMTSMGVAGIRLATLSEATKAPRRRMRDIALIDGIEPRISAWLRQNRKSHCHSCSRRLSHKLLLHWPRSEEDQVLSFTNR